MIRAIEGTIERRLLINYRVDPSVAASLLPAPFEPVLVGGVAVAGICLIQLRVRPQGLPQAVGVRSLSAAHRIAVTGPAGAHAVYIPRRDTTSRLARAVSGRFFPGHQHLAQGSLRDHHGHLHAELASYDGSTRIAIDATRATALPASSIFHSLDQASAFFHEGATGYSDRDTGGGFDSIEFETNAWMIEPIDIGHVESSFFSNTQRFPSGSAELDNALLMADIPHRWIAREGLRHPAPGPQDAPY